MMICFLSTPTATHASGEQTFCGFDSWQESGDGKEHWTRSPASALCSTPSCASSWPWGLRQASAPLWTSVSSKTFHLDSGFVTWYFGFPWLGGLFRPPAHFVPSVLGILERQMCPLAHLAPTLALVMSQGNWKRWPWTICIFLKGPSQQPAPQSYCSKPSRDLGSLALIIRAKSGQQINPSTEWTES